MNAKLCNDDRLQVLLSDDEESAEFRAAARHVEMCRSCQERLTTLAGAADWWNDAHEMLDCDEPRWNLDNTQSSLHSAILTPHSALDVEAVRHLLGAPSHPEMLGRLGRYDIERVIGSGGMGIVLKAHDSELNRPIAIKVLASHLAHVGAARERFAREGRAAAAVVHEHVVAIYNVETEGAMPFLVMQFVPGRSLQTRVDEDGPLGVEQVLRIGVQAAAGLAAAHRQGLVHRDVKPSNILLEDTVERAVLTDFGLARAMDDASLTQTGIVAGTPHYMSPEQASGGPIDHRSDLFSLGSVLYFMATGRPPFRATGSLAVLHRICREPHRPVWQLNSEIPDELCDVIDRLLEKKPGRRFASAEEVGQQLADLLSRAQQRGLGRRRFRALRDRRVRQAVLAASTLVLLVTMGLFGNAVWKIAHDLTEKGPAREPGSPPAVSATGVDNSAETVSQLIAELAHYNKSEQHFVGELIKTRNAAAAADTTHFLQQGDFEWERELGEIQRALGQLESQQLRDSAAADPTIEDIQAAWRNRQAKLQSVRVQWNSVVVTPVGTHAGPLGGAGPTQDVAHDRSTQMLLDGDKLRYSWTGFEWREQRDPPGFYPQAYVSASDGETSVALYRNSEGSNSKTVHPVGFILDGPEHPDARGNYHIETILLFARPLSPAFGFAGKPDRAPSLYFSALDGVRCAVITEQFGRQFREIWIDPAKDCVIRRYVVYSTGKLSYEIEADYTAHPQVGWVPQAWRIHHWLTAGDRPHVFESAEVTSLEINPPIEASEFLPAFPAGTVVRDARTDIDFLVKSDGGKREITREERRRNATYEEILQTESGEAGRSRTR